MPRDADGQQAGHRDAEASDGQRGSIHLLRAAHLFAAAIRERLLPMPTGGRRAGDLSPSQLLLLRLLVRNGARRIGDVAGLLGVTPPATTRAADRLVHLGLVGRRPVAADRRVVLVVPSAAGCRLVAERDARDRAAVEVLEEALGAHDFHDLVTLLERSALALLSGQGTAPGPCLRCAGHLDPGCPLRELTTGCPLATPAGGPRPMAAPPTRHPASAPGTGQASPGGPS